MHQNLKYEGHDLKTLIDKKIKNYITSPIEKDFLNKMQNITKKSLIQCDYSKVKNFSL